jgi:hypothetical protein
MDYLKPATETAAQKTRAPTAPQIHNFEQRLCQHARELHKLRQNPQFMGVMTPLFEHCEPLNIAKLLKFSGFGGRVSAISIEECCRTHSGLADQIKQHAGNLLEKPLFSDEFYLAGEEAKLLLDICDFGISEEDDKTIAKIENLKSVLILDSANKVSAELNSSQQSSKVGAPVAVPTSNLTPDILKSLNSLGMEYLEGSENVKQDYKKALECFEKAVAQECSAAHHNMGFLYEEGYGVQKNGLEALKWYQKAASLGASYSYSAIGTLFYEGNIGIPRSWELALVSYLQGVKNGDTVCCLHISNLFSSGMGIFFDVDSVQAASLWDQKFKQFQDVDTNTLVQKTGLADYFGKRVAQARLGTESRLVVMPDTD